MSIELVTGYTGEPHVTSAQARAMQAGMFGTGGVVLPTKSMFAASLASANEVVVGTGDLVMQGAHVTSEAPTSLEIANGSQGMKRNDLVVCRYTKDPSTLVESAELVMLQGTPSASTPSDPAVASGSILDGAETAEMPLYRISLNGVNVSNPVALFELYEPFLVESRGGWTVQKWLNGRMRATKVNTARFICTTAYSSIFTSGIYSISLPSGFKTVDGARLDLQAGLGIWGTQLQSVGTSTIKYYAWSARSLDQTNTLYIEVEGTWK